MRDPLYSYIATVLTITFVYCPGIAETNLQWHIIPIQPDLQVDDPKYLIGMYISNYAYRARNYFTIEGLTVFFLSSASLE